MCLLPSSGGLGLRSVENELGNQMVTWCVKMSFPKTLDASVLMEDEIVSLSNSARFSCVFCRMGGCLHGLSGPALPEVL